MVTLSDEIEAAMCEWSEEMAASVRSEMRFFSSFMGEEVFEEAVLRPVVAKWKTDLEEKVGTMFRSVPPSAWNRKSMRASLCLLARRGFYRNHEEKERARRMMELFERILMVLHRIRYGIFGMAQRDVPRDMMKAARMRKKMCSSIIGDYESSSDDDDECEKDPYGAFEPEARLPLALFNTARMQELIDRCEELEKEFEEVTRGMFATLRKLNQQEVELSEELMRNMEEGKGGVEGRLSLLRERQRDVQGKIHFIKEKVRAKQAALKAEHSALKDPRRIYESMFK